MFVILVNMIGRSKNGWRKSCPEKCREYLFWIQNSVLEGELTEMNLRVGNSKGRTRPLLMKSRTRLSFTSFNQRSIVRGKSWSEKGLISMEGLVPSQVYRPKKA